MAAKILLVEDDNNLREIYEARLQAEGYAIVTAKDGEEALVVAKAEKPDLVISDVMMPRISGFEMLDILRNTDELKYTKVIMLTALGQADDKTRANSLGADRYLVKSQVTLEDIVKAAHELIEGSTGAPASGTPATASPAPASPTASTQAVGQMPVATPPTASPTATVTPMPVATPPAINTPATQVSPIPAAAPMPTPQPTPATTPAPNPAVAPTAGPATMSPVVPAQPSVSVPPLNAPTTADEQAATAAQINQFVSGAGQSAPAPQPNLAAANAAADDAVLANAVNDLATSTAQPAPATPAMPAAAPPAPAPMPTPQPTPAIPPAPAPALTGTGSVPIANKKVIQPLQGEPKPGLDELLAREEAKNIMGQNPNSAMPAPGMPQAGNVFGVNATSQTPPGKPNDFDPNNIAL